ncbi:hypothetical protein HMP0015_0565 [Acinetobacter haemolyticus ATCC 19194]|uniref:Uncharacterized protein n=1 Tax=Acinetobacter haemolyticus ATCC 19194 TaxID=707232 RepID=D4XLH3_ACIHA|nr:hypothetical protein [Acinetobacter haemolyticus]EFF83940.1 hypothetical protein HMP0015_0565 [Acinetobacter haemolyticus ATCC 19194]
MNRKYYSTYVFYAVMSCFIVVGYAYLRGESFQWLGVGIALILGIIFISFIVRLPVFSQYYIPNKQRKNAIVRRHSIHYANRRAAPVMSGLVSAMLLIGVFYLLGFETFKIECFVGAIVSAIMSFYYEL